jgi:hypothetical protein
MVLSLNFVKPDRFLTELAEKTAQLGESAMKKVYSLIVCLVLVFVVVATAAADGPPWPASVFIHTELGQCYVNWLTPEFEYIVVFGQGVSVYQEKTGNWSGHCNAHVDFEDPSYASLSEVCENPFYSQLCKGKGAAILRGGECNLLELGLKTYDSTYLVQPSGNIELHCVFNGAAP